MGRIKTQLIKRITGQLLRAHGEEFSPDFEKNKLVIPKYVELPSKKIRNTIAGYLSRIKKMGYEEKFLR
ncbi:MAG TPA: 30S ribosomal protein S17e [Candidatus Nanoarchaeia archaeon]|nr:30S ribosomal protein S17e [Candidatus Nanoarchaeia archaeon]